jgi:hypothetical protein
VSGNCQKGLAGEGPGQLDSPDQIAIDNSGNVSDPSNGDVYVTNTTDNVIDKFTSTGAYLGQIATGVDGAPFKALYGVAVDPKGELWVSQNGPGFHSGGIQFAEFDNYSDGEPNKLEGSRSASNGNEALLSGFAVDSEDGLYTHNGFFSKLNSAGKRLVYLFGHVRIENQSEEKGTYASGIAVDLSRDNVYLDTIEGTLQIEEFTSNDAPVETFGAEQLAGGGGGAVAVDASNQTVYVADGNTILVYPTAIRPNVLAGQPSALHTEGSATLNGTVDPEGLPVKECKFEYVSDAVFKEPLGGANEVQALTDPVGTKFKLEFKGTETAVIYGDEEAGEVQEHLEEIPSLAGNVKVEGPEGGGGPWTIEFIKGLADEPVPAFTVTEGTATVAITTEGSAGGGWAQATKANCEQEPSKIPTGSGGQPVSAPVTGLTPDTLYDYRLAAGNTNGLEEEPGEPQRFVAPSHPATTGESASAVGSTTATLQAQVDPGGATTSYYVEYGTIAEEACFTSGTCPRTGQLSAGAGQVATGVQLQLNGLQPETEYHYRFVSSNVVAQVSGTQQRTFTTTPAVPPSESALPDGRVYELVSPPVPGSDADVYAPCSAKPLTEEGTSGARRGLFSCYPFQVAPDGDALAYLGQAPPTGGNGKNIQGGGNEFLARRSAAGGWTSEDIQPPGLEDPHYVAFSSDLSQSVLKSGDPLAEDVPVDTRDLYAHATAAGAGGEYAPLLTGLSPVTSVPSSPPGVMPELFFAGANAGGSGVPAFGHVLFEASNALPSTPQALAGGPEADNLYDAVGGQLYSVNVLPASEGGRPDPNAAFGGVLVLGADDAQPSLSNAISADGSRIFWTALEDVEEIEHGTTAELLVYRPKALYVRENDTSPAASTLLIAEHGQFVTANSEGSEAFFTKEGGLYQFDVETQQTITLAPPAGEVQGVLGTSEKGEYVYFAADGVLSGANAEHHSPTKGQNNIYLSHGGAVTFIASGGYSMSEPDEPGQAEGNTALDRGGPSVTPDGQHLLFESEASPTGYDNVLEESGKAYDLRESYLYEAGSGKLRCVSCDPTGAAPVPTPLQEPQPIAEHFFGSLASFSADDGSRVFFDSAQPLVPQATNGYLDVYEWERAGTPGGSCPEGAPHGGCIFLLSSGADQENSYLIGSDPSGENVFFVTRADMNAQDRGDDDVVYDARVNGVQPPAEEQCAGTGCQGVPPAPPIFATPASVTFAGTGNFPLPPPPKKVVKKTVKCTKGKHLSHNKCVKTKHKNKKSKAKKSAHTNRRTK